MFIKMNPFTWNEEPWLMHGSNFPDCEFYSVPMSHSSFQFSISGLNLATIKSESNPL